MKPPIVSLTVLIAWFPLHATAGDQTAPANPTSAGRSSSEHPVSSPISAAISAGLPKHFKNFADTLLRVGDVAGSKELNTEIRRTFFRHPDTLIDAMDKSANNGRRQAQSVAPKASRRFGSVGDLFGNGEKTFPLGSIVSSPTVDRGVIYVGSTDGNVYALE